MNLQKKEKKSGLPLLLFGLLAQALRLPPSSSFWPSLAGGRAPSSFPAAGHARAPLSLSLCALTGGAHMSAPSSTSGRTRREQPIPTRRAAAASFPLDPCDPLAMTEPPSISPFSSTPCIAIAPAAPLPTLISSRRRHCLPPWRLRPPSPLFLPVDESATPPLPPRTLSWSNHGR